MKVQAAFVVTLKLARCWSQTFKFYLSFVYVMGKALSGELLCSNEGAQLMFFMEVHRKLSLNYFC